LLVVVEAGAVVVVTDIQEFPHITVVAVVVAAEAGITEQGALAEEQA
jgi:hypothetical protein